MVVEVVLKIAGAGDEGYCGDPESFRLRGRARKQGEEILRVREASAGRDDTRDTPRPWWVVTVVAQIDGGAGGHGGARAALG